MKTLLALAIVLVVAACAPAAKPGWTYGPIASAAPSSGGSTEPSTAPDGSPSAAPDGSPSASTSSSPSASTAPSQTVDPSLQTIAMIVKDFTLDPNVLNVSGAFALTVTNQGPTLHNITIRAKDGTVLVGTKDLREGESEVLTVDLQPGTYTTFCSLPGHESLGIVGSLTVNP